MIYIETICDDSDTFRIERQKNTPNGEWYGLWLYLSETRKVLADNEEWILSDLYYSLRDNPKDDMKEMGLEYNKKDAKALLKLIKKAIKLGWFNHLKI